MAEIQAIQAEAKAKESALLALRKSRKIYLAAAPLLVAAGLGLILATDQRVLEVLGGVLCGAGAFVTLLALKVVKKLEALDV